MYAGRPCAPHARSLHHRRRHSFWLQNGDAASPGPVRHPPSGGGEHVAGGEDDDVDTDSVADELYALPPDEFTTARDARAAQARSAGERELAAAIKKLRRPTAGAWLANQLVRERQDQLAELLDLGEEMRQAQSELAGNELRRLAQERRQVVNALIEEARNVGRERGRPVSDASAREVESTLEAAVADPGAADALRQGRLVTALQYSGFGPADLTGWAPAASGPATGPPESATAPRESATAGPGLSSARSGPAAGRSGPAAARPGSAAAPTRRERSQERRSRELIQSAQRELRAAEAAAARAERDAANHERRVRGAQSERDRVYSQVVDLERRLRDARAAEEQALRDLQDAEEAQETADREVRGANDRIARARTELDRLAPPGV